jgi:Protein of unknown function (DUF998)
MMKPTLIPRLVTASAVTGVIGPIFFAIVSIVLGLLWAEYDPLTQTISELGATNAPAMDLQALNFAILGILTMIFAVGLSIFNGHFHSTSLLLGVYWLGTLLVGGLSCDPGCSFKGTSLVQIAHSLDALVSFVALTIVPLFFWRSSKKLPSWLEFRCGLCAFRLLRHYCLLPTW